MFIMLSIITPTSLVGVLIASSEPITMSLELVIVFLTHVRYFLLLLSHQTEDEVLTLLF